MSDIFNAKETENKIKTTAFVSLNRIKKIGPIFFLSDFHFHWYQKKYKVKILEPAKHIIIPEN